MDLDNWFSFKNISSDEAKLVIVEAEKDIPFAFKRTYFILDIKSGESRGFHAHKELKQVALCLKGSCDMLLDDGKNKKTVKMDSSSKGLLIDRMIWHEMHNFSADCVFAVFADDFYKESDYIRNYDDFLKEVNSHA